MGSLLQITLPNMGYGFNKQTRFRLKNVFYK